MGNTNLITDGNQISHSTKDAVRVEHGAVHSETDPITQTAFRNEKSVLIVGVSSLHWDIFINRKDVTGTFNGAPTLLRCPPFRENCPQGRVHCSAFLVNPSPREASRPAHTNTRACTHACTHARTHTNTHKHTHTHTHTHTVTDAVKTTSPTHLDCPCTRT